MNQTRETSEPYQHLQLGYGIMALVILAWWGLGVSCLRYGNIRAFLIFSAMLLFLAACFYSLRVTVNETSIRLRFGIGFIRKEILLRDVLSWNRCRNPLLSGWGVLRRKGKWIYNVSGWDSVELGLKHDQIIRIGTNDAEGLMEAIRKMKNRNCNDQTRTDA